MDTLQIESSIGPTDRGSLKRATHRQQHDRIVRIIDPHFCDRPFRQSLSNLQQRTYPRMLPISDEGWSGVHLYIEYDAASSWETLIDHFQRLHWRQRLSVIIQICDVLPQWHSSPIHPLGLNGRNIVMVKDAGHWFPWLLPCPPLHYSSPCDLFGTDSIVIAALAPEVIRGIPLGDLAQDVYALGTLSKLALGCKEVPDRLDDETRIEAQACGTLLVGDIHLSEVEPFLRKVDALGRLIKVINRYAHVSYEARPTDVTELRAACVAAIQATDPLVLAKHLMSQRNLTDALEILRWGFKHVGESWQGHQLSTELCEQLDDIPQALQHLDIAIALAPREKRIDLLWKRANSRLRHLQQLPLPAQGATDPEGTLLLKDLEVLKQVTKHSVRKTAPYKMVAFVYRRRQDLIAVANELHDAAELEPSDMEALWLYGECLQKLGDDARVEQLLAEAGNRIDGMVSAQLMRKAEAEQWLRKFNSLLKS